MNLKGKLVKTNRSKFIFYVLNHIDDRVELISINYFKYSKSIKNLTHECLVVDIIESTMPLFYVIPF